VSFGGKWKDKKAACPCCTTKGRKLPSKISWSADRQSD